MEDAIETLPTDTMPPTSDEKEMMKWLFSDDANKQVLQTASKLVLEFRTFLWIGVFFVLFSLPQLDPLIRSFLPLGGQYAIVVLLLKTFCFMLVVYILFHLSVMTKKQG